MGAIVFLVAVVIAADWFRKYLRSMSNDMPARGLRKQVRSKQTLFEIKTPVVTPVDQVKEFDRKVSEFVSPIIPHLPSIDPKSDTLPNFSTTPSPTEESILLRILTQGILIISIITLDLAAGIHYSWIAIPFATVGAVWSWYRRHHAKHWLNIGVSIICLLILLGLLVPILVTEMKIGISLISATGKISNTIALGLGMLLTALWMGLSFHLYNRRILGYCLLISCLLMGVAASLSQGIDFLILLAGFMAMVIPVLMLDYRSIIALKPIGIESISTNKQLSYQHLPWKYLSQLTVISIVLGLILAVFLPKFHAPDLSFNPPGLDKLANLAPKITPPQANPPIPQTPPPPPETADKMLRQPGNNNYPDVIKQHNLELPPEIAQQLKEFSKAILATSPQPLDSEFDRATYLAQYIKQHHQIDPQQLDPSNLPPIDAKLIQQLIDKCSPEIPECKLVANKQDLPSLYTSMVRSIDIPARLKTGDKLAEIDPKTKMYPRSPEQAHSQSEVYFPNWGWYPIDVTPNQPLLNQTLPPAPTPASTPAPIQPPTSTKWEPDPVILRIIIAALAMCGGIAWYLWYQHQQQQQLAKLPAIEQIYRSMVADLSKRGLTKHPAQTQLEYAHSANNIYQPQITKVVWEISQTYTAWRYGKHKIDTKQLAKKLQHLQHLQQLAAKKDRKR